MNTKYYMMFCCPVLNELFFEVSGDQAETSTAGGSNRKLDNKDRDDKGESEEEEDEMEGQREGD